jgi:hypothetical protein
LLILSVIATQQIEQKVLDNIPVISIADRYHLSGLGDLLRLPRFLRWQRFDWHTFVNTLHGFAPDVGG